MRTETITKTYAQFNELNEDQKSKVLDKMRDINVEHYEWYEHVEYDFHTILEILGYGDIESAFTGFWSQGGGASFKAKFNIPMEKGELKERMNKLLEYAPEYFKDNEDIKDLFLSLDFKDWIDDGAEEVEVYKRGRYEHECTMFSWHEALQEFSRLMAARYYNDLEKSYNHLVSDESVKEAIESNEYEFDLDTLELS